MSELVGRRGLFVRAAILGGVGALLAWEGYHHSARLRVSPAVAIVVATILVAGAVRLVQLSLRPESTGNGFAVIFSALAATVGGWIAFGEGARECTFTPAGHAVVASGGSFGCRIPFGIGALVMLAVLVVAGRAWLHERFAREAEAETRR